MTLTVTALASAVTTKKLKQIFRGVYIMRANTVREKVNYYIAHCYNFNMVTTAGGNWECICNGTNIVKLTSKQTNHTVNWDIYKFIVNSNYISKLQQI